MKIVSWNINGLRATLRSVSGSDLKGLLDSLGADVVCFQETKATRDQIDESLYLVDGYNAYFSFCQTKKGYSGVVTFCRNSATPIAAEEGLTGILSSGGEIKGRGDLSAFTDDELSLLDSEGRAVLTEHCFREASEEENGKEPPMAPSPAVGGDQRTGLPPIGEVGRKDPLPTRTKEETAGDCVKEGGDNERSVVIVNVYCPMYDRARDEKGEGLSRLEYKMKFYRLLEARCTALEKAGKVVLAVGDFNCSPQAIDSAYLMDDPNLEKDAGESKDWMRQFAVTQVPPTHDRRHSSPSPSRPPPTTNTTLLDTFRYLHPTEEGAYTCWSTLLDSRKTNYGTRIDFILSSVVLAPALLRAEVWQQVQGSDHCPVFAEFNLKFVRRLGEKQLPSLCSCWFSGRQSKLLDFMTRCTKKRGVVDPKAKADNSKETTQGKLRGVVGAEAGNMADTKAGGSKGRKRTKKSSEKLPPPKRTLGGHQKSLISFSTATPQATSATRVDLADRPVEVGGGPGMDGYPGGMEGNSDAPASAQGRKELSAAWKNVFGSGPKPPACSGHKEPCVLRTVKKQGENKDRQFWVCARPMGSKGDPQARCDFFKWVKEKKKVMK